MLCELVRLATALFVLHHSFHVYGALVNVTVDDQGVDPTTGQSLSRSSGITTGQTCGEACASRPDVSQAFNGTWLDTTFSASGSGHTIPQNVTFSFRGTFISPCDLPLLKSS